MRIYATLKSDEQHGAWWEDGKNGDEKPMFCNVSNAVHYTL